MPIKRYLGQPLPIVVKFESDPLVPYGFTYADIVEVSMNLKKDLATDADDAYLQRTQTDTGVTVDTSKHTFAMQMDQYGSLVAGDSYFLVVAVDVGGSSFIELKLDKDSRRVDITTDENRA